MSKTHLLTAIATSLLVTTPHTPREYIISITGAALGGVISDIDILKDDTTRDAIQGQILFSVLAIVGAGVDYIFKLNIINDISKQSVALLVIGIASFITFWIAGLESKHRSFTHSILGMLLFAFSVFLMAPMFSLPFLVGFITHIALDLFNKKKVRLLYPIKGGVCFKTILCQQISQ